MAFDKKPVPRRTQSPVTKSSYEKNQPKNKYNRKRMEPRTESKTKNDQNIINSIGKQMNPKKSGNKIGKDNNSSTKQMKSKKNRNIIRPNKSYDSKRPINASKNRSRY